MGKKESVSTGHWRCSKMYYGQMSWNLNFLVVRVESMKSWVYVRRKPGERLNNECVLPAVKHDVWSVMLCGGERGLEIWFRSTKSWKKNNIIRFCKDITIPSGLCIIGKEIHLSTKRQKLFLGSLILLTTFLLNYYGMNWIGEFKENIQRIRMSFFYAGRILGQFCHLFFFKNCRKKMLRICKAEINSRGGCFNENKI